MSKRNGMIGFSVACLLAAALLAAAPIPAAAGDRALVVNPAIYRTAEGGASGPSVQLVRRFYYGPRWGYGYARPYYAPYVYAPPPVVNYGYSYPAYSYSYPAYGYGYGYPAYGPGYGYGPGAGVGFYGPRVGVGVGVGVW